jgi:LytR cell envelope-related transcriptional attenuator
LSEVDDVEDYADDDSTRPSLTPAQRRARRQMITLLVVGGVLLVSFVFAAAYYGGWFDSGKPAAQPCAPTKPTVTVAPSQVKLNVYNASKRNGLAAKVAAEMKARGFAVGTIANDPLRKTVKVPAEVRYGKKGKAGAQLVSSEVTGAKLVPDKRTNATVDLVLGGTYKTLGSVPTAGATTGTTCTPSPTTTTSHPSTTSTPKKTKKS